MYKALYGDSRLAVNDRISFAIDVLGVAGMLYIGALARIPLPFTPAPLTLQTLVVLVAPFLLGRSRALAGIGLYLVLGLSASITNVSVFTTASGATCGYLAGFLVAPVVMARFPKTPAGVFTAMAAGSMLILLLGALWLSVFLRISPGQAVLIGLAPFLPGDMIKVALACVIVRRLGV
ncbi:MAG TPA: biotin transporter BioY [Candidatus Hydrogenedentes bacterium]|nr:biotin transporter BioY [Candidatus Hydrogenedentota bacterium]